MTAEQQGSDESGEGLSEAEQAAIAGSSGIVCRVGGDHSLFKVVERILAVRAEAALATARRDADELRGRLAAVGDERDALWAHVESLRAEYEAKAANESARYVRASDGVDSLPAPPRAALANPSAAQGEAKVGARVLREAADAIDSGEVDHEELRQAGVNEVATRGWSDQSVIDAHDSGSVWRDWLRARADSLATDAPEASQ